MSSHCRIFSVCLCVSCQCHSVWLVEQPGTAVCVSHRCHSGCVSVSCCAVSVCVSCCAMCVSVPRRALVLGLTLSVRLEEALSRFSRSSTTSRTHTASRTSPDCCTTMRTISLAPLRGLWEKTAKLTRRLTTNSESRDGCWGTADISPANDCSRSAGRGGAESRKSDLR